MDRKLLFFDLDGTLVTGASDPISESAVIAMKQAQANGHLCFVNSGRPMGSIGENITRFPFDGYVCGCGTTVIYHGRQLLHTVIDQAIVEELVQWNRKERIDIFFEGEHGLYFPPEAEFKDLDRMETFFTRQGAQVKYYQYDETIEDSIDKFSMWFDPEDPPYAFRKYLEKHFDVIERSEDFWEIVPKGYSKATGIDVLLNHLKCDKNNTLSFGDSQNDISMLIHTKEAVVMGNGDKNLMDIATYVTTPVDEDGIANAIRHFGLI